MGGISKWSPLWVLRIGIAAEFAGHGLLALGGKADWIAWTQKLLGVDLWTATLLMTLIGLADLAVALIVLYRPLPSVLLWATFWGFWTALVRPLVGIGWLDFIERGANWAAPLALYLMLYGKNRR